MPFRDTLKSIVTFGAADTERRAAVPVTPTVIRPSALLPSGPAWQKGRATWPSYTVETFATTGYAQLATVYRCVNILANAIATAPVKVYRDQDGQPEELPDHPLRQLLRFPNRAQSEAEFLNTIAKVAAVAGFVVCWKVRGPAGRPVELQPLRSDWLVPVPRGDGQSHDWEYRLPDGAKYRLDAADVLAWTFESDPRLSPVGVPPLAAALREVGIAGELATFVKTFFERGAVPYFGLILNEGYVFEPAEAEALRQKFMERSGLQRAVDPVILESIKDIKRLGVDLNELAASEIRNLTQVDICTAFGVPPILVGIQAGLDASTYSNYGQARRAFYEDTVSPLWARLDGAISRSLLPEFATEAGLDLAFDLGDVAALRDDEDAAWQRANTAVLGGWATVADARRAVGLPELPGTDVFLRQISLMEVEPGSAPDAAVTRSDGPGATETRETDADTEHRAKQADVSRKTIARIAGRHEPAIAGYFRAQERRVVTAATRARPVLVGANGHGPGPPELRAADDIDWTAETDELQTILDRLYRSAGTAATDYVASFTGVGVSFDLANPWVAATLDKLALRVVDITDTTRKDIQRVVTDALADGVSGPQLADRLHGLYAETYNGRSSTIARTESQVAYNTASAAGYRESGVVNQVQLLDNPNHTDSYGASDGLTCAERHNRIVDLAAVERHILAEHPNGSLVVTPILAVPLGTAPIEPAEPAAQTKPARPRTVADHVSAVETMGVTVSGVTKHPQMGEAARTVAEALENLRAMDATLPTSIRFYANPKTASPAFFTSSDQILHVNLSAKWKDMKAIAANQKKHGFWSSDDPLHTIYHEAGHAAHYRTLDEQGQADRFDNKNWFGPRPSKELVSRYAATNPLEFVAEVYAATAAGTTFPSDVLAIYRQYGGPELPKRKRRAAP